MLINLKDIFSEETSGQFKFQHESFDEDEKEGFDDVEEDSFNDAQTSPDSSEIHQISGMKYIT